MILRDQCRLVFIGVRGFCLQQNIFILLLAIIIGILSGYGALLFQHVLKYAQYAFYQNSDDVLTFHDQLSVYQVVGLPVLGGLLVGLIVHFLAREAKGHGVPEVMTSLALYGGRIRKRVALVKIMASAICIGSGGSSGREGPMVQIGSSIGSTIGQFFKVTMMEQRTMVGCGAAAGIAATFNAPIAGVLFALEIIIGDFGLASFSPVVLSSVTATAISRYYFGDLPAFIIPQYELASLWEFCVYPFLGVTCAVAGVLFVVTLYKAEDTFEAMKMPDWLKPALGGFLLGLILLKFPQAFGVGYGAMNMALHNEIAGWMLLTLVFVKIATTSCTLGSGGSGGIFAPSLFIGSMAGGFFGWAAGNLFPQITASPAAYALVGMGGVVAGTTHAPITAILIIFEMTGDYKIILPMMITCIVSTMVAQGIKSGSIYTIKLKRRGIDIAGGLEQNILKTMLVQRYMRDDVVKAPENMPLSGLIDTFKTEDASYLHVTDADGRLTGVISFRDIRGLLEEEGLQYLVIANDVATRNPVTVKPSDNIQHAMKLMSKWGISQLPVVNGEGENTVIGVLRQKDVVAAYDKAIIRREIEAA